MTVIVIIIAIVGIIIIGEFIKLLLTLNDCYKFILGIVIMVIKGKRKHLNPSGEYNYDNYNYNILDFMTVTLLV